MNECKKDDCKTSNDLNEVKVVAYQGFMNTINLELMSMATNIKVEDVKEQTVSEEQKRLIMFGKTLNDARESMDNAKTAEDVSKLVETFVSEMNAFNDSSELCMCEDCIRDRAEEHTSKLYEDAKSKSSIVKEVIEKVFNSKGKKIADSIDDVEDNKKAKLIKVCISDSMYEVMSSADGKTKKVVYNDSGKAAIKNIPDNILESMEEELINAKTKNSKEER